MHGSGPPLSAQARRIPENPRELVEEVPAVLWDPMTEEGKWNVVLLPQSNLPGSSRRRPAGGPATRMEESQARGGEQGQGFGGASVLVAPESALPSIRNAQILGVVSSSTKKSIRIYNQQESYDRWLFFYGQDPKQMPEIEYYGQSRQ
jgi:hypothetical protein